MGQISEIDVGKLKVRPEYQRTLNELRVGRIAKNFNKNLVGVLDVSEEGGSYWVVDGQHRLAAMRKAGVTKTLVLIHRGLSIEEEAGLFAKLNTDRRAVTPLDLYRAEVIAGNPHSTVIRDTLAPYGLQVTRWQAKHSVQAVGALWSAQAKGTLADTIRMIVEAWGNAEDGLPPAATDYRVIGAIASFIRDYQKLSQFDLARLREVLGRHRPEEMIRDARGYESWKKGTDLVLRDWYNHRLPRPNRIEG